MRGRTAEAEVTIDVPLDVVWDVVLDLDRYPEWNPFTARIDHPPGAPAVGDDLVLHVRWSKGRGVKTHERITQLVGPAAAEVAGATLEYEFLGPVAALRMVRGRRQQELEAIDERTTRYRTHERLHGWLVRLAPLAKVQDGFERQASALKARAEEFARSAPK